MRMQDETAEVYAEALAKIAAITDQGASGYDDLNRAITEIEKLVEQARCDFVMRVIEAQQAEIRRLRGG